MAGWMQTIIVGNVGRDPQLRYTPDGVPVCDFSVAVTRRTGSKNETGVRAEVTTWFKVTCWRQAAETAAKFVVKGAQIMVVGTVSVSAYLDKNSSPAAQLELKADSFTLMSRRESDAQDGALPAASDIPF